MEAKVRPFAETLASQNLDLKREGIDTLQINVGRLCNQACRHCHVEAGPRRKEIMELATVRRLLDLLARSPDIRTIDMTGGAPELNPHFRDFVCGARELDRHVIDRCNLTVLFEPGQKDTGEFLREHRVEIVASLPCYAKENVDRQRGNGVFAKSIRALRLLNELGYGLDESGLVLNLVFNPQGTSLPPSQRELEAKYKAELRDLFGIAFNHLYTITNMPIRRFLKDLERQGKLQEYMDLLVASFNPKAVASVMCTSLLSVSWDGLLFDCDFNQMLNIPLENRRKSIWDIESFAELASGPVATDNHCYACTAGSGSSCTGAVT